MWKYIFQSDRVFSDSPVIWDIAIPPLECGSISSSQTECSLIVRELGYRNASESLYTFILKQNSSCIKVLNAIFCPDRALSGLIVVHFLQGEQCQINPSGDLEDEQETMDIAVLHPEQDIEFFIRFFWNIKSRALSRETVDPLILSRRQ